MRAGVALRSAPARQRTYLTVRTDRQAGVTGVMPQVGHGFAVDIVIRLETQRQPAASRPPGANRRSHTRRGCEIDQLCQPAHHAAHLVVRRHDRQPHGKQQRTATNRLVDSWNRAQHPRRRQSVLCRPRCRVERIATPLERVDDDAQTVERGVLWRAAQCHGLRERFRRRPKHRIRGQCWNPPQRVPGQIAPRRRGVLRQDFPDDELEQIRGRPMHRPVKLAQKRNDVEVGVSQTDLNVAAIARSRRTGMPTR